MALKYVLFYIIPILVLFLFSVFVPELGMIHGYCTTLNSIQLYIWFVSSIVIWLAYTNIAFHIYKIRTTGIINWMQPDIVWGFALFIQFCGIGHLLSSTGLLFWARWDLVAIWETITAFISLYVAWAVVKGSALLTKELTFIGWQLHQAITQIPGLIIWCVDENHNIHWSIGGGLKKYFKQDAPNGILQTKMHLKYWPDPTGNRNKEICKAHREGYNTWSNHQDGVSWTNSALKMNDKVVIFSVDSSATANYTRKSIIKKIEEKF